MTFNTPLSPPSKKEKLVKEESEKDPLQNLTLNPCIRYNQKSEEQLCEKCKHETTCQRCNRIVYDVKGKKVIQWSFNYQYDKICDRCDKEMQIICINCKRSQKLRGPLITHLRINDITKLCEKCKKLKERLERTGSYNKIRTCYVCKIDSDQYDSNDGAIVCSKICFAVRSVETAIRKDKRTELPITDHQYKSTQDLIEEKCKNIYYRMRSNEDDEEELIDENLQELITNTKKFFNNEFQRVEFIKKEEIKEIEKEIRNLIGLPPEIREEINKEYQTAVKTQNQQTKVLHQEPILKEAEEPIQFDPEIDKFQINASEFQWKETELSKPELANPETSQTEVPVISDQPQIYDEWLESLLLEELKQIARK